VQPRKVSRELSKVPVEHVDCALTTSQRHPANQRTTRNLASQQQSLRYLANTITDEYSCRSSQPSLCQFELVVGSWTYSWQWHKGSQIVQNATTIQSWFGSTNHTKHFPQQPIQIILVDRVPLFHLPRPVHPTRYSQSSNTILLAGQLELQPSVESAFDDDGVFTTVIVRNAEPRIMQSAAGREDNRKGIYSSFGGKIH
jgi:hypothetical protein